MGFPLGIFGIGLIAEALAPRCKALGMTVVGFGSTRREVAGFDRMHLRGEFLEVAPSLDSSCCSCPTRKIPID